MKPTLKSDVYILKIKELNEVVISLAVYPLIKGDNLSICGIKWIYFYPCVTLVKDSSIYYFWTIHISFV